MHASYPFLEFDGEPEAILEPDKLIDPLPEMLACAVITFFLAIDDTPVAPGAL